MKKSSSIPVHGFQSPQNGKKFKFKRAPLGEPLIQILNVKRSHWIVATTLQQFETNCCIDDTVVFNVYDSGGGEDPLDLDAKQQICSLVQMNEKKAVTIKVLNTQRQPNGNDCGLFALANATELALNKDQKICFFDVACMRDHLLVSLENCKISSFPTTKERRVSPGYFYLKIYTEFLLCLWQRINEPTRPMLRCSLCKAWFHFDCVGIHDHIAVADCSWFCSNCDKN